MNSTNTTNGIANSVVLGKFSVETRQKQVVIMLLVPKGKEEWSRATI